MKNHYHHYIVVIDEERVVASTSPQQTFVSKNVRTVAQVYSDYDTANAIAIAYRCFLIEATRAKANLGPLCAVCFEDFEEARKESLQHELENKKAKSLLEKSNIAKCFQEAEMEALQNELENQMYGDWHC